MPHARRLVIAAVLWALSCQVFPDEIAARHDGDAPDAGPDQSLGDAAWVESSADVPSDVAGDVVASGGGGSTSDAKEAGCSADISSDPNNCGKCGNVCSSDHVAYRRCVDGKCDPICLDDRFDCASPALDDGCETVIDQNNCGSCFNKCPAKFVCSVAANMVHGVCQCESGSCGSAGAGCSGNLCICNTADGGQETCRRGEACGPNGCQCNGGPPCKPLQFCCGSPVGCVNPYVSSLNCGGCGWHCPNGFLCEGATCKCDQDGECNAGSPGTCSAGRCVCNGVTCDFGERCQSDKSCA